MPFRPPSHRPPRLPRRDQRPSAAARGYDARWQKLRAAFLAQHPLCADCARRGLLKAATDVDHIIPHQGQGDGNFWRESNLQPLCHACHARKGVAHDGLFGRAKQPQEPT